MTAKIPGRQMLLWLCLRFASCYNRRHFAQSSAAAADVQPVSLVD